MVWLAALAASVVAALVTGIVVPRVAVADPEGPDFRASATPRWVAVSALVTLAAAQVLWLVPAQTWWLWLPYLALGAPAALVDLHTTWLPRSLTRVATVGMAMGLVGLAVTHWPSAAMAVAGGVAAYCFLYVAYRLTSALGFGDVRLIALVGAVAGQSGLQAWVLSLLAGTALGALHGIGHAVWRARGEGRAAHFPYGPALWLGPIAAAVALASGW